MNAQSTTLEPFDVLPEKAITVATVSVPLMVEPLPEIAVNPNPTPAKIPGSRKPVASSAHVAMTWQNLHPPLLPRMALPASGVWLAAITGAFGILAAGAAVLAWLVDGVL